MDDPRVPNQGRFLAHGAAAEVWLIDTPTDCKCVLKIVRLTLEALKGNYGSKGPREVTLLWEDYTSDFRSKVDQWTPLSHANVIRVLGLDEGLNLRVEYLPCGTASQYLAERPQAPNSLRRKMIGDVMTGLAFLHSQNPPIVHGCIRMDKLFVDYDGTTKFGEFGLASMLEDFGLFAPSIHVGQYRWMSPELLQTDERPVTTRASDVWALGCTLFEIVSGKQPYFRFKHDLRVLREILSNKPPGHRDNIIAPDLADFWTLVASCWRWAPEERPTVNELIQSSNWMLASTVDETNPTTSEAVHRIDDGGSSG